MTTPRHSKPSRRIARAVAGALALVAGGLPVLATAPGAHASCSATDFPFHFELTGFVDSEDAHGFTVDRLRVVYPLGNTLLPWNPAHHDLDVNRSVVDVGARVQVVGSLRADGTVLAQSVLESEDDFVDDGAITWVSGVLEEVGATSVTIDGHEYPFLEEEDRGAIFVMDDCVHELPLADVHVGDALAFALVVDEDSGDTVLGTALVRPTGDGAVLGGRVTSNTGEEGGDFFGHSGTYFEVEGVRAFFPSNEDLAVRAVAREHNDDSDMLSLLEEGDGVRMTGWFRDDVFFVEDVFVAGSESGARPPRAVVAEGIVTRAGEDELEVNGVAFRKPTRRGARRAAEAALVGDRVRVKARPPVDDGDVVARTVRTFRRR
jgi:hypothetical protein